MVKKNTKTTSKSKDDVKSNLQTEKIAELEAAILYGKAEAENARKRSLEEIDKTRKYAIEKICSEMLLVKDSLDAAITVETATVESYKDGVELTLKQLISIFDKFNIKKIDAQNQEFDPNFHQAMTMVESEKKPNQVLSVIQEGYKLNDRVLRPALVTVSKKK
jgi:molecular chaperone GrpE|tara:strand:- start:520 stop:1008 length:489 start_codon:yes stop_codon:yes gene_type:complete